LGVSLGWQSVAARQEVEQRHHQEPPPNAEPDEPEEADEPMPAPARPVDEPSPELLSLMENTLPTQQNEWLPPIFFAYDSDAIDAQGIAMLHEVARELQRRPGLAHLEIRGYADARGSREHNLALSKRRAQAVLDWLVAHGVERERLTLAAEGAAD